MAIDDITFSACNPVIATNIINNNSQNGRYFCIGTDTTIAFNSTISGGYNNLQYQWQYSNDSGNTWLDIKNATDSLYTQTYSKTLTSGIYLNRVAVAAVPNINDMACRVISGNDSTFIKPLPIPSINSNTPLCAGNSLILTATGGITYNWRGPANFAAVGQPAVITAAQVVNAGEYFATVVSPYGCEAYDSVAIVVNPSPKAVAGPDVGICEGTATQLSGAGGGYILGCL